MNEQNRGAIADVLQEALLATLRYATSEVPFYQSILGSRGGGQAQLSDFPVIDRATVDAHLGRFVVAHRFPDYMITSGGTTGEPLALTFRIEEEYEAVHSFLTGLDPREAPPLEEIHECVLDVYLNTNGYFRRKAVGWPTVSVALERRAHADVIRRIIAEGVDLGARIIPVGRMQAQIGVLRTLTGYFLVAGFAPSGYGIRSITGYGGHVSRVWRERLREFWGAQIDTRYGLSEFTVGNATECAHCKALHYLTAWPEFLSLRDRSPVEEGDALLALTSLVPFVVVQPRIRYLTGDIVTIHGRCKETGLLGFRFRGRFGSSVWEDLGQRHRVVMSEINIAEVLDRYPEVNVRRHTAEIQLWEGADLPAPPFPLGSPRFVLNAGPLDAVRRQITLRVELALPPDEAPDHARSLVRELREAFMAEVPGLEARIGNGELELDIDLFGPGKMP